MAASSTQTSHSWAELFARVGYARYFCTVGLTRVTGSMFNVAVVLLVLQRTGSLSLAGLTAAAGSLPAALTGPFLGAWLDVARSRRALIALDQLTTVGSLAGMLMLAGHAANWTVPALGLVYGATRPLSAGAFFSVLPEIVGPDLLPKANTMEATSINIAFIVGPALAGWIAGAAGPAVAVESELALTVLAIGMIVTEPLLELRPPGRIAGIGRSVREGLAALGTIVPLRAAAGASALSVVGWGSLTVSFPAFGEAVHAGAHASGYLWAAISVGSITSAFLLIDQAARMPTIALTAGSMAAMGLSAALWPLAGTIVIALLLVMLTGMLEGPALAALFTIRQRHTPPQVRGQVFATLSSLNFAGWAIGSALAGLIYNELGTPAALLMFTFIELAAAGAMLTARSSLRDSASHA